MTFLSWSVERNGEELLYYGEKHQTDAWFRHACRRALEASAVLVWTFYSESLERIADTVRARRQREAAEEAERELDERVREEFAPMDEAAWHAFLSDYYGKEVEPFLDSVDVCYDGLEQALLGLRGLGRRVLIGRYGKRQTFKEIELELGLSGARDKLFRAMCLLHNNANTHRIRAAIVGAWRLEEDRLFTDEFGRSSYVYMPPLYYGCLAVRKRTTPPVAGKGI